MKEYVIKFSDEAEEGKEKLQKSGDKQVLKKLYHLINELRIHPTTGTGKPKPLKGFDTDRWSRRITDKHRLIYDIFEEVVTVEIIQTHGHYDDK
jgi:toxin YoeB